MTAYVSGSTVRMYGVFSVTGVLTDPSVVTGKVKPPGATTLNFPYGSSAQLVRDGIGLYHLDMVVTATGLWRYRWEGSGSASIAGEGTFDVSNTVF